MSKKNFYGWFVLAGLFVMYVITNGVILNTLPIFYPELVKAFGWDQAVVTQPAQLLFLAVALFSPVAGIFLDRYSARLLMLVGSVLLLAAFVWYSRMNSLREMQLIYILFALGITLAGIIPSMHIVTRWFIRNRGLAVGILLIGSSLGGAIFNQVAGSSIEAFGWRTALLILGAIAVALVVLPLIFVVRNKPEDVGLAPDTMMPASEVAQPVVANSPTLAQAASTPTFYLLLLITGAMWFCIVGVIQHQALYFKDLQTMVAAKNVLSLFFLSSIAGKVFFGWLSDRFPKKNIMLAAVLNLALGALLLALSARQPNVLLWLYALVFGIGFSGTFTMIQLLVAEFYAGSSYGKILGIVTMIDTLAGVLGIMALGKMRIASGSYQPAFQLLVVICLISALCVLLLHKPRMAHD